MLTAQTWIVCEKSGRWTAALRTAFARLPEVQPPPRLREVRTLDELSSYLEEHGHDLALIEAGGGNLTAVLQLMVRRGPMATQFVALVDDADIQPRHPAITTGNGTQPIVDLLWEAGAMEVVESPRQLNGLLALHDRLSAAHGTINSGVNESQSFADWAWSTLPWQDP
jgi:hypothetical protein